MSARAPGVVEVAPMPEPVTHMPQGLPELVAGPLVHIEGNPMADCLASVRATEHHYAAHRPRSLGALTLKERRVQAQTLIAGGPW